MQQLDVTAPAHFSDEWQRCYVAFLLHVYDQGRSRATLYGYGRLLHLFFSSPKSPAFATRAQVEAFASRRRDGRASAPATRNHRLTTLSSFYKFASDYLVDDATTGELVPLFRGVSPVRGIRPSRLRPLYRAMSFEELARFFAVIPADMVKGLRDRAIFLVYFWTARRRSEIARLCYGDLSYGTILGRDGSAYDGWIYRFSGKGDGGADDFAELPSPAKEAIDAYLVASGRLPLAPGSPLWLRPRTTDAAISGTSIYNLFKGYCLAAGLDTRRLSLHSLRHTATQLRMESGEDLRSLQHLLRHKNIATTSRYLEGLSSAADPGSHKLMADPRFAGFGRGAESPGE